MGVPLGNKKMGKWTSNVLGAAIRLPTRKEFKLQNMRKIKKNQAEVATSSGGLVDGMAMAVIQGKDRHEDNTDGVHAAISAARTAPAGLMMVFRGEGVLGPFPVLELCDRLQELRLAGKRVVMVAQTWLGAPDLLLWMQGTERFLTNSGYGHIKVPAWSKYSSYVSEKASVEHPDAFWAEFLEPEEAPQMRARLDDPRNYAYEKVLEKLNEYFPVPEYVNKVVPRDDLAELGLITGEGLDKYLVDDVLSIKPESQCRNTKVM